MTGIAVTVDAVVFVERPDGLAVLLIRRANPPFQGKWALPGGFVDDDEDLAEAAARELAEETGVSGVALHQLGAYGAPGRDPRGRTVSIAYWGVAAQSVSPHAGDDAAEADIVPVAETLADPDRLAFDHHLILSDAVAALTGSRQSNSSGASAE